MGQRVTDFGRTVTITLSEGHEFDFEVKPVDGAPRARLFAERWANKRLPLSAVVTRQIAQVVAEQQLRRRGLL